MRWVIRKEVYINLNQIKISFKFVLSGIATPIRMLMPKNFVFMKYEKLCMMITFKLLNYSHFAPVQQKFQKASIPFRQGK